MTAPVDTSEAMEDLHHIAHLQWQLRALLQLVANQATASPDLTTKSAALVHDGIEGCASFADLIANHLDATCSRLIGRRP